MRILYLLLPFFLLVLHSAAGSSLAPGNKKQCEREKGHCVLLNCSFPYVIAGKCSTLYFCCKK
ncbi:AMP1 protein, partial [Menura novaehollandiae]|nr:AMP1 protein [Menura novaehollandiae]